MDLRFFSNPRFTRRKIVDIMHSDWLISKWNFLIGRYLLKRAYCLHIYRGYFLSVCEWPKSTINSCLLKARVISTSFSSFVAAFIVGLPGMNYYKDTANCDTRLKFFLYIANNIRSYLRRGGIFKFFLFLHKKWFS